MLREEDILKRLIVADSLFRQIDIVKENYDILPNGKKHIGTYIGYCDLQELRAEFLDELGDTIIDWVYSTDKFRGLKERAMQNGKSESMAYSEIYRKAKNKFRGHRSDEKLLVQGQMGELLLFHFMQHCMKAVPILRKMPITTSPKHERFGADAIHYKIENDKHIIFLGEAKTYTSKYQFNNAFADAIDSILSTYYNHRQELDLYVHEDFLDKEMDLIAERYLQNTLNPVEVHLVSIVTYNETQKIKLTNESDIKEQIKSIIFNRYAKMGKDKIDIENNPILNRITYIVFPVWRLDELVRDFQSRI